MAPAELSEQSVGLIRVIDEETWLVGRVSTREIPTGGQHSRLHRQYIFELSVENPFDGQSKQLFSLNGFENSDAFRILSHRVQDGNLEFVAVCGAHVVAASTSLDWDIENAEYSHLMMIPPASGNIKRVFDARFTLVDGKAAVDILVECDPGPTVEFHTFVNTDGEWIPDEHAFRRSGIVWDERYHRIYRRQVPKD